MVVNAATKDKAAPKKAWRERINLSLVISVSVAFTVIAASLTSGFFALRVLYQNKMLDTWAIMFLELEHQGLILRDELQALLRVGTTPDGELFYLTQSKPLEVIKGNFSPRLKITDLGFDQVAPYSPWPSLTIVEIEGQKYLGKFAFNLSKKGAETSGFIRLWRFNTSVFGRVLRYVDMEGRFLYLMTREGRLIYSSSPDIQVANVATRPLVQKFIRAPLTHGQMSLTSEKGVGFYGFFYEIPASNIVIFSEVEQDKILGVIFQIAYRFLLILGGIVVVTLLLLQIPLKKITSSLREMTELAARLGNGEFNIQVGSQGFGELKILSSAFSSMSQNLLARDESIRLLMIEQTKKVRLEGELEIASKIQQNLLPLSKIPKESGLDIAAVYLPASECAGDWYSYAYNPKLKEAVFVIVDVSGHGAGSSMFSSMIAGLFDQFRDLGEVAFPIEEFATKVNRVLHRLGARNWHATMMIGRFIAGSGKLKVLFAGHTPGILHGKKTYQDAKDLGIRVQKGSQPLGIGEELSIVTEEYDFSPGSRLIFYTDGLTEARNLQDKIWGFRNLRTIFAADKSQNSGQSVDFVVKQWKAFREGRAADDDACIIVVRAL